MNSYVIFYGGILYSINKIKTAANYIVQSKYNLLALTYPPKNIVQTKTQSFGLRKPR